MAVLQDYFAAEQPILTRLNTLVPQSFRSVQPALSVEQCIEYSGTAPAAFLIFASSGVSDSTGGKRATIIETQTWIVAVVARNAQDTKFNQYVRQDAGPLLFQVDRLLLGYSPSEELRTDSGYASTLRGTTPPEAFQYLPGLGVFLRAYNLSFVNSGLK